MPATHPGRDDILQMLVTQIYGGRILNNAHRGDVVEMMVLSALGSDWRFVSLGWHPWDLQRGTGATRVRIQVKQVAALQLWGATVKPTIVFGWKKQAPSYFFRDHPDEPIESEGWFCDLFVCGLHLETDRQLADQADPAQWLFLVIPTSDLKHRQDAMPLAKALERWHPLPWTELAKAVTEAISGNGGTGSAFG